MKHREIESIVKPEYEGMSFMEIASKDLKDKLQPIQEEIDELKSAIDEAKEMYHADIVPMQHEKLISILTELRKKLEAKEKEYRKVESENRIDFNLSIIASELDDAPDYNKGVELTYKLYNELAGLVPLMNEASVCFKSEARLPITLVQIRNHVAGIFNATSSNGLPAKKDIKKLEKDFYNQLAKVQKKNEVSEATNSKFDRWLKRK